MDSRPAGVIWVLGVSPLFRLPWCSRRCSGGSCRCPAGLMRPPVLWQLPPTPRWFGGQGVENSSIRVGVCALRGAGVCGGVASFSTQFYLGWGLGLRGVGV